MTGWLTRTSANWVSGPYSREEVVKMIEQGKLGVQDEVCRSNHYWFYLHEHQEVLNQLGIQMPRINRTSDDEVTETQIEAQGGVPPVLISHPPDDLPEVPGLSADDDGQTSVLIRTSGSSAHEVRQAAIKPSSSLPILPSLTPAPTSYHSVNSVQRPVISVSPQVIEKPSIWRGVAWALSLVAAIILYLVLNLLQAPQ